MSRFIVAVLISYATLAAADCNAAEANFYVSKDGVDAHSLAVDRLFVDPENGVFRLKPDSPARKLGIVSIDLSKVGLAKKQATDETQIEHR